MATTAAEARPQELTRRAINLIFVTILLGILVSALDQTVVSTALPTIVGDLGGAGHVAWVATSYILTDTIATVLAGKLGDAVALEESGWAAVQTLLDERIVARSDELKERSLRRRAARRSERAAKPSLKLPPQASENGDCARPTPNPRAHNTDAWAHWQGVEPTGRFPHNAVARVGVAIVLWRLAW